VSPLLRLVPADDSDAAQAARRLLHILPWFQHNALVHYLSPRGLEQFSGGGWGTRDVCQGPVELLLATGRTEPIRDLLCRVYSAQNRSGDWPQWFMFFERERGIRAGDSHGDIVYWPLLALGQYLLASGDAALLLQPLPYFEAGEPETLWQHAQRALALAGARTAGGTALAAYGHGDWNDALQPADPQLREHMCSSWTVTLHHQALCTLSRALREVAHQADEATALQAQADRVLADFHRLLVIDGEITGYALFKPDGSVEPMLHPRDRATGVRHSLLPMMHAIINDMLSPAQAQSHLALIRTHLSGPDGARLFDKPMDYHGGPQTWFQRAESSSYFGREIGLMYTHAHLRYAEALAHLGEAQAFLDALGLAHPVALHERLAQATRRQANCYYSSSDAAFDDRYQASTHYGRIASGEVALEGGWRVYSSGAGIGLGLVMRQFLGLRQEAATMLLDPVMPAALDGLRVEVQLGDLQLAVRYRVGPKGHGVQRLQLNGRDLPFQRQANPYRVGAAAVSGEDWRQALATAPGTSINQLQIEMG
jgi:CRISPR-associated protein Csx3